MYRQPETNGFQSLPRDYALYYKAKVEMEQWSSCDDSKSTASIQFGPKITERHTSGNKDIRWLVSVDGVSSPEKNDTKISHFG